MGAQTLNIPGKVISKTTTATMPDDETMGTAEVEYHEI